MRLLITLLLTCSLWGQLSTAPVVQAVGTPAIGQAPIVDVTGVPTWQPLPTSGVPGYSPNQVISGCGVQYTGTGLVFHIGICNYTINGVTYTTAAVDKTLSAADGSNPRIDLIGVNTSSAVFVTMGTPATDPQQPTVATDGTELQLTFVLVPTGSTTPGNISVTTLYDENTEWTSAVSANFNCASTTNPYHLTKDCEATTAALNNNFTLTKPAAGTENLSLYNNLLLYIRSKATWPTGNGGGNAARSLSLFWLNGSTQVGQQVTVRSGVFGFDSSNTSVYQQVSIPISLFGTGSNLVTTLKVNVAGVSGSTSIGFYIDWITLQGGTVVVAAPQQHVISFTVDGNGSVIGLGDIGVYPVAAFNCAINRWDISADQSGSITVDVWKRAGLIPTSGQKISASAPLTLSTAQLAQNGSRVGWTLAVSAGDVFGFSVATVGTVTRVTGQIWCQ